MATSSSAANAIPADTGSRRSSKLLIGLLIAAGLVVAGGAAYVLVPRFMGSPATAEAAKAPVP